jgi:hypothetical protein
MATGSNRQAECTNCRAGQDAARARNQPGTSWDAQRRPRLGKRRRANNPSATALVQRASEQAAREGGQAAAQSTSQEAVRCTLLQRGSLSMLAGLQHQTVRCTHCCSKAPAACWLASPAGTAGRGARPQRCRSCGPPRTLGGSPAPPARPPQRAQRRPRRAPPSTGAAPRGAPGRCGGGGGLSLWGVTSLFRWPDGKLVD